MEMSRFLRGKGVRPNIWAHRGASAIEEENTMPAFAKAIECGADGIELDVRLTGDREVVVFHDKSLERQFGKPLMVDELTLDELREETKNVFEIPTLGQVLEAFGGECLINVEIKEMGFNPIDLVKKTTEKIRTSECLDSVLISSFDPKALASAAWFEHRISRALLFGMESPLGLNVLDRLGQNAFSALHPESVLINEKKINTWHKRGLAIHVWTVDDPNEILRLSELGVDSFITNVPDIALSCF